MAAFDFYKLPNKQEEIDQSVMFVQVWGRLKRDATLVTHETRINISLRSEALKSRARLQQEKIVTNIAHVQAGDALRDSLSDSQPHFESSRAHQLGESRLM